MNSEFLLGELLAAIEAELESDSQVRDLPRRMSEASKHNSAVSASDMAKIVSATLALNEKLRGKTESLRKEHLTALRDEILVTIPVSSGTKAQLQRVKDFGEAHEKAKAIAAKQLRGEK